MEGTFRSVEPLAFSVNTTGDLNENVIKAFAKNDKDMIKHLCSVELRHFDIFICVNRAWHASVLCVPLGNPLSVTEMKLMYVDPKALIPENPFNVPDNLLCPIFELSFDIEKQRMYKIKHNIHFFQEIKNSIKKSFFIGRYAGLNISALQFTALGAAPRVYAVLLDDCVEFAKTFCIEALAFSSNYKDIEKSVEKNIEKASGSGLSVEQLSRKYRASGFTGNTFLGGMDTSTWMSGSWAQLLRVLLLLVYPIVAAFVVVYFWERS